MFMHLLLSRQVHSIFRNIQYFYIKLLAKGETLYNSELESETTISCKDESELLCLEADS